MKEGSGGPCLFVTLQYENKFSVLELDGRQLPFYQAGSLLSSNILDVIHPGGQRMCSLKRCWMLKEGVFWWLVMWKYTLLFTSSNWRFFLHSLLFALSMNF